MNERWRWIGSCERVPVEQGLKVVLCGSAVVAAPGLRRRFSGFEFVEISNPRELHAAAADADVLVTSRLRADDTRNARRLRLIQTISAGSEGIEHGAVPDGCALCNVHGHEVAIAEWVVMSMIALARAVMVNDRRLRQGIWNDGLFFQGVPYRELRGRTVGVVGFGHVGQEVVRVTKTFGMRALAVTRGVDSSRADAVDWLGGLTDVDYLTEASDFVVVALPLAATTECLIQEKQLTLIGGAGFLVNVARGEVVSQRALYEALRARRIAGAALDVWYHYPSDRGEEAMPARFPFWELENVILSPHCSGWTAGTIESRVEFVGDQLRRLVTDEPLENVIG
jgi:phosphoglycerate dehydrogenase-like enzyme